MFLPIYDAKKLPKINLQVNFELKVSATFNTILQVKMILEVIVNFKETCLVYTTDIREIQGHKTNTTLF